jgi:AcrR family transcriptional regulator
VYNSNVREDGAQRTRIAILNAAEQLFAETGYARTKLPDIATGAGVALNTVYASVGGKKELVAAIAARYVDHEVVHTALNDLDAATTVDELLRRMVAGVRRSYQITLRPALVVVDAARDDAAIEPIRQGMTESFRNNLGVWATRCAELHPESTRPDPRAVADVFWFFVGYGAWKTLEELGWDWDEREAWTGRRLADAIADLAAGPRVP